MPLTTCISNPQGARVQNTSADVSADISAVHPQIHRYIYREIYLQIYLQIYSVPVHGSGKSV